MSALAEQEVGRAIGLDRATMAWADWPEPDKQAWEAAIRKGDALDPGGPGEFWSAEMQRAVKMPYRRWLGFLRNNGMLDPGLRPHERVIPERVRAFVTLLRQQIAPATVSNYVTHLYLGLCAMAPEQDWSWLGPVKNALRRQARPMRDKRRLVVPSDDLFAFGLTLMDTAEQDGSLTPRRRAVQFRDGLAIAMLAARPIRLKNFAALRIGLELVHRGGTYWLVLTSAHTKTRAHLELPYPDILTSRLERYFSHYRQILLTPHGRMQAPSRTRPPANFLWVSEVCSAMGGRVIYQHVVDRTRERFGRLINPHLFRDCVATSVAIEDPVRVGITQTLLGHASPRTAERHYNHARSVEASRQYQRVLLDLRRQARKDGRSRRTRTDQEN